MRPIKFRAWDQATGEMIPIVAVMPLGGVLVPDGESKVGDAGAYQKHYKYRLAGKVEVMQFTGLLDKNGKEIYEGDILMFEVGDSWAKEQIIFADYCWRVGDENADYGDRLNEFDPGEIEVIGNIYENSDLLSV